MSLVVDRYELGPIGTNCYVVRAEPGASEAVVFDPGADGLERFAAGLYLDRPLDDQHERVLPYLVLAELLARLEPD